MTKDLQELIEIIKSKKLTEKEKVEQVQTILSENPELVNAQDNYGYTPLIDAANNGSENIVKLLIESRADVNVRANNSYTPLLIAASKGYENIVKLLTDTKEIDVNAKTNSGSTPLFLSAQYGYENLVKLLINKGADVNIEVSSQWARWTPLLFATHSGYKNVAKLLIEGGANVNAQDQDGYTPLHFAARNGSLEIVQLLLAKKEIDVNLAKNDGETALIAAINRGRLEVVQLLLAKEGIKANLANNRGETPLYIASRESHLEVVKALLAKEGIKANLANNDGRTPLRIAVRNGHIEASQLIIEHMLIQNFNETKPDFLKEELSNYWDKCSTEINKEINAMKEQKIGNSTISLFDILVADENKLALYMNNEDVVEVLSTSDYKEKFPIYASKIEDQYQKGVERKCALNPAKNYFSKARLSSTIPVVKEKFNEYIFQEIFKYADNALLKAILSHRDELTSVEGAQSSAVPQRSMEDDKTVSGCFSGIKLDPLRNKKITTQFVSLGTQITPIDDFASLRLSKQEDFLKT